MTSETKTFAGLGTYTLSYTYYLAGQLKTITNPSNNRIDYTYNRSGSLATVGGTPFAGVTRYIDSIAYRAWGATKQITHGSGASVTMSHNPRMLVTQYAVTGVADASYPNNLDGHRRPS